MTDNFGQFADTVQGASVFFLKTGPSSRRWDVHPIPLQRSLLQLGIDGGAGIVHGVTDPGFTTVIMQRTEIDDCIFFDGSPVQHNVLVLMPPSCHFTIVRETPVQWLSWSLVHTDAAALALAPIAAPAPTSSKTDKVLVTLPPASATRLRAAAESAFASVAGLDPPARLTRAEAAERMLRDEWANVWVSRAGSVTLPLEHTRAAERTVFLALDYARSKPDINVHVGDLVASTGVRYRTLLRAFEHYLRISPKRYLKLRQINLVYHAIRKSGASPVRVTDILAGYGVNEFGRFAGEYKALFGESPSETQRRFRAREAGPDRPPPLAPPDMPGG